MNLELNYNLGNLVTSTYGHESKIFFDEKNKRFVDMRRFKKLDHINYEAGYRNVN